jgi:hypothetical protein
MDVNASIATDRLEIAPVMDFVEVIARTPTQSWSIRLSRVPSVHEQIEIDGKIYVVLAVAHVANFARGHAAEISVELPRR